MATLPTNVGCFLLSFSQSSILKRNDLCRLWSMLPLHGSM